ncbi:hypothetical protein [Arenimonas sp. MALMAid1274]|uniref:hypothetical protein n=1 Tax=Arenimonas sp. MALMAid1274 TaxID=3411630 RepID=UPI003BA1A563
MARNIHALAVLDEIAVAIVETASSGGQWGAPVRLATVRMHTRDLAGLTDARILGNSKFEQIEAWTVNGASRGERSKFSRTLSAMKDELLSHLGTGATLLLGTEEQISPDVVQRLAGQVDRTRAAVAAQVLEAAMPVAAHSVSARARF